MIPSSSGNNRSQKRGLRLYEKGKGATSGSISRDPICDDSEQRNVSAGF